MLIDEGHPADDEAHGEQQQRLDQLPHRPAPYEHRQAAAHQPEEARD